MGAPVKTGLVITYEKIAELTDNTLNSVQQAATVSKNAPPTKRRQPVDIFSLESVILYVAKHGKKSLRRKIAALAAPAFAEE